MSLRAPTSFGFGSKERSSHSESHSIHGHIAHLRSNYQIPRRVSIDGLILPVTKSLHTLYSSDIFPALEQKGHVFHHSQIDNPVEIQLPNVFNPGTLTIAQGTSGELGDYQGSLTHTEDTSIPVVHYKTNPHDREKIDSLLYSMTLLAALPKEVLLQAKENSSVIVFSGAFTEGSHDYSTYGEPKVLKLSWDEENGNVNAVAVRNHVDFFNKSNQVSKSAYFVLEERVKHREYDTSVGVPPNIQRV